MAVVYHRDDQYKENDERELRRRQTGGFFGIVGHDQSRVSGGTAEPIKSQCAAREIYCPSSPIKTL
jgi:hypothetical protein